MNKKDKLFIISASILGLTTLGLYTFFKKNLLIEVRRLQYEDNFTYGKMFLNGSFFCDTLEDTYRGQDLTDLKVYGNTAIPNGKYKTIVSYSPKFGKDLPELLNVPYFTNIRIHTGTGVNSTDGCILVGDNVNGYFTSNNNYTSELVNKISSYPATYTIIH